MFQKLLEQSFVLISSSVLGTRGRLGQLCGHAPNSEAMLLGSLQALRCPLGRSRADIWSELECQMPECSDVANKINPRPELATVHECAENNPRTYF